MAKRSRESFQKRAREKARQEKQEAKRARRQASSEADEDVSRAEEDVLMAQFAKLSERLEAEEISVQRFNEERERIFGELGLETD